MKKLLSLTCLLCLALALSACEGAGPKSALDAASKALQAKDSQAFLALVDMKSYAAHEMVNLKQDHKLLNRLDSIGGMLGLGSELNELLDQIMDLENRTVKTLNRTVSSGELANMCTKAQTPDCPWVPESLAKAEVKSLSETEAVARVTTPANMTSWIALRKADKDWKIVGKAVLEEDAARFARDSQPLPQAKAGAKPL